MNLSAIPSLFKVSKNSIKVTSKSKVSSTCNPYSLEFIAISLIHFGTIIISSLALFFLLSTTQAFAATTVTLGDGVDPSVSTLIPGASATNVDSFTLRTSTSSATISQVLVKLKSGTKNDGITWTSRTSAADNYWSSVTYGNGLFVSVSAFGPSNRVMLSLDGITWTSATSAADNNWRSVTYGNGLFVAVSDSGTGNRVMTSPNGITWTSRTSAADNGWYSVTYGNGLFVAVSYDGIGNRVMTSPDGITWTIRTSAADNSWISITYGNGLFVASSNNYVMLSSLPVPVPTNNKVTLTFTTPPTTDISNVLVLKSISASQDTPQEGFTYATSSKIGTSDVSCSFAVTTSTTYTCSATYNVYNGTPYYFTIYTKDTSGNYSIVTPYQNPTTPGRVVTLTSGSDPQAYILVPGASATTSDTFTLQTDTGTDSITSVTLTLATSTATSTSLIEITDDTGTIVYGATSSPTTDTPTILLSGLSITTTQTQYRVRITPKSHVNMPVPPGAIYTLTSYVSSFIGAITNHMGTDTGSTTLTIDNASPGIIDLSGQKWRIRTSAADNNWRSVTYGNGLFVAVSEDRKSVV